jgi:transposase InsO family protein
MEARNLRQHLRRNVKLFVLPPPRSPKLNGYVERAHRTHTEEFYEVTESSFDIPELREELLEWEQVYNTVRPHQALGYITPLKFLER